MHIFVTTGTQQKFNNFSIVSFRGNTVHKLYIGLVTYIYKQNIVLMNH